uniref:Uncharacterized protein n=1 Tax=Anguilla anguilla TaxID=7936 RepID=A0A0E9RMI1_ANGAN
MIKCQSLHLALDCEFREGRDIHSVPPPPTSFQLTWLLLPCYFACCSPLSFNGEMGTGLGC